MKKSKDLNDEELQQIREKFKEKHKRSILTQGNTFNSFFHFKSCLPFFQFK
jgi:ribonuclease HIII